MEGRILAAWEVPFVLAAAFVGANRWLDKKLKEIEEDEAKEKEAEVRYKNLAEGVVPDLYQFYQEMDGVIDRLTGKDQEENFCKNMNTLVEFLCSCKEPDGNPTVQNILMTAMAAKNCEVNGHHSQFSEEFAKVIGEHLLGEIGRTSTNPVLTRRALEASAEVMKVMFTDKSSELSTYKARKLKEVKRA